MADRVVMWTDAMRGVTFFGHGIGSWYSTFPIFDRLSSARYGQDVIVQPWHAHNEALETLFELGIPGLVLAGALVLLIWWRAGERERLVLIAFAPTAMLSFPLHEPATEFLFVFMAGFAARGWDGIGGMDALSGMALHARRLGAQFRPVANCSADVPARS